jgi:hypothetical protein
MGTPGTNRIRSSIKSSITLASRLINSADLEGGPLKARTNPQSSPNEAMGQEYGMVVEYRGQCVFDGALLQE